MSKNRSSVRSAWRELRNVVITPNAYGGTVRKRNFNVGPFKCGHYLTLLDLRREGGIQWERNL
jgi:hypothetical protein